MAMESDLRQAALWVSAAADLAARPSFTGPYHALRRAAEALGTAWCGSWLPQFAHLYDRELKALPVGLRLRASGGGETLPAPVQDRCRSWTAQEIRAAALRRAGCDNDWALQDAALGASVSLNEALLSLLAPLECALAERPHDARLRQLAAAAEELAVPDKFALIEAWRPRYSRLHCARTQGLQAPPPHIELLASLDALLSPFDGLRRVAALMLAAAEHLQATAAAASPPPRPAATPAGAR